MATPSFLIIAISLTLVLSMIPWGKYVLYPFKIFTTWAHECSHALMAVLLGGEVKRITLCADTSGLCVYQVPPSRMRQGLVTSAGYLGSCIIGCLIYGVAYLAPASTSITLTSLGVVMLLTLVFWVRNSFGVISVFTLGFSFIALGRGTPSWHVNPVWLKWIFSFLGIQTALQAVLDLRSLFQVKSKSDAHRMEALFWLPAWFWALLWCTMSVCVLGFLILKTTR